MELQSKYWSSISIGKLPNKNAWNAAVNVVGTEKIPHNNNKVLAWDCAHLINLAQAETETSGTEERFSRLNNAGSKTYFYFYCDTFFMTEVQ